MKVPELREGQVITIAPEYTPGRIKDLNHQDLTVPEQENILDQDQVLPQAMKDLLKVLVTGLTEAQARAAGVRLQDLAL